MKAELLAKLFSIEGVKSIFDGITAKIEGNMYTVNIAQIDWYTNDTINKIFFALPESVRCEFTSDSELPVIKYLMEYREIQHDVTRVTFFRGVPIWINIGKIDQKADTYVPTKLFLKVINTKKNREVLKEFIAKLCVKAQRVYSKTWREEAMYFNSSRGGGCMVPREKMRTFDDIFIPDDQLDIIKHSLDKFVHQRNWYVRNKIPYHFGILLHGDPGTGKSVLAQAIASYVNARFLVLSGDTIKNFPEMLGRQIPVETTAADAYQVILVEDIDCGFKKENSSSDKYGNDDDRELGLAGILNAIDGFASPSNTIFVFTTNNVDELDPALIRPGRCDLSLEIRYANKETFDKFCEHHYGEKAPSDLKLKDNVSFAQLQCETMRGMTLNELCEFVRKEDKYEK